jgi:hypothetical protein
MNLKIKLKKKMIVMYIDKSHNPQLTSPYNFIIELLKN